MMYNEDNTISLWDLSCKDILDIMINNPSKFDSTYITLLFKAYKKEDIDLIKQSIIYPEIIKKVISNNDCLLIIHFILYYEPDLVYDIYKTHMEMAKEMLYSHYSDDIKEEYLIKILCHTDDIFLHKFISESLSRLYDSEYDTYHYSKNLYL